MAEEIKLKVSGVWFQVSGFSFLELLIGCGAKAARNKAHSQEAFGSDLHIRL